MGMVKDFKEYPDVLKEFYFKEPNFQLRKDIIISVSEKEFSMYAALKDKNQYVRKTATSYFKDDIDFLKKKMKDHSKEVRQYARYLYEKIPSVKRFIVED
jgi:hypothetical protein